MLLNRTKNRIASVIVRSFRRSRYPPLRPLSFGCRAEYVYIESAHPSVGLAKIACCNELALSPSDRPTDRDVLVTSLALDPYED